MRRLLAWVLSPALLAQACASGAPPPPKTSLEPASLAAVNRSIEGEPVTLELADGRVIRDAEGVLLQADSTSWQEGDRERTVPTAEVCKVIRGVRHRAGKGYLWGLLACTPAGVAAGQSSRDSLTGGFLPFVLTEGICALVGMLVASGFKLPPDQLVYTAPGSCGPRGEPSSPH